MLFGSFCRCLQVIMVFKPEEVFWPPEIDDLVIAPGRGQVRHAACREPGSRCFRRPPCGHALQCLLSLGSLALWAGYGPAFCRCAVTGPD